MSQIDNAFAELEFTKKQFYENHAARMNELNTAIERLNNPAPVEYRDETSIELDAISDELDKLLADL